MGVPALWCFLVTFARVLQCVICMRLWHCFLPFVQTDFSPSCCFKRIWGSGLISSLVGANPFTNVFSQHCVRQVHALASCFIAGPDTLLFGTWVCSGWRSPLLHQGSARLQTRRTRLSAFLQTTCLRPAHTPRARHSSQVSVTHLTSLAGWCTVTPQHFVGLQMRLIDRQASCSSFLFCSQKVAKRVALVFCFWWYAKPSGHKLSGRSHLFSKNAEKNCKKVWLDNDSCWHGYRVDRWLQNLIMWRTDHRLLMPGTRVAVLQISSLVQNVCKDAEFAQRISGCVRLSWRCTHFCRTMSFLPRRPSKMFSILWIHVVLWDLFGRAELALVWQMFRETMLLHTNIDRVYFSILVTNKKGIISRHTKEHRSSIL